MNCDIIKTIEKQKRGLVRHLPIIELEIENLLEVIDYIFLNDGNMDFDFVVRGESRRHIVLLKKILSNKEYVKRSYNYFEGIISKIIVEGNYFSINEYDLDLLSKGLCISKDVNGCIVRFSLSSTVYGKNINSRSNFSSVTSESVVSDYKNELGVKLPNVIDEINDCDYVINEFKYLFDSKMINF